jgi:hypothetical protein
MKRMKDAKDIGIRAIRAIEQEKNRILDVLKRDTSLNREQIKICELISFIYYTIGVIVSRSNSRDLNTKSIINEGYRFSLATLSDTNPHFTIYLNEIDLKKQINFRQSKKIVSRIVRQDSRDSKHTLGSQESKSMIRVASESKINFYNDSSFEEQNSIVHILISYQSLASQEIRAKE